MNILILLRIKTYLKQYLELKRVRAFFFTIEKPLNFLSKKTYFEFNFKYLHSGKERFGSFMCWINTNLMEFEGVFFNDPLPDNMIINNFFEIND